MKVYFIITGLLRSFINSLYPFLTIVSSKIDCEFIIYTTNDIYDSKYSGSDTMDQLHMIISNPKYKLIYDSTICKTPDILSQREKNTIYQWFRIQSVFNLITSLNINDTDIIVRLRPDINIRCTVEEFIESLNKTANYNGIYVPIGNDLFNETYRSNVSTPINDQFAFGQYKYMKHYCSLYSEVDFNSKAQPIISEQILYEYLSSKNIAITRIPLEYKLCLSECKIIAIAGDSGVGKSTVVNALHKIFPFDSNLILEADRYHKWERHDDNWKKINHLYPEANYLEYMIDDTYRLKLGEDIEQVDYDHSTGKFTSPQSIHPKPFIFLCGLHTLYKSELRTSIDLKIYVDVQYELKKFWKVQRDIKDRGYSKEKATSIFNQRINAYNEYILPQKEHADIEILYFTHDTRIINVSDFDIPISNIECSITCSNKYLDSIKYLLENTSISIIPHSDKTVFMLNTKLTNYEILKYLHVSYHKYILNDTLEYSSLSIIQCMFIILLLNPDLNMKPYKPS